jgi:hypothetical protein
VHADAESLTTEIGRKAGYGAGNRWELLRALGFPGFLPGFFLARILSLPRDLIRTLEHSPGGHYRVGVRDGGSPCLLTLGDPTYLVPSGVEPLAGKPVVEVRGWSDEIGFLRPAWGLVEVASSAGWLSAPRRFANPASLERVPQQRCAVVHALLHDETAFHAELCLVRIQKSAARA